jgi:predicted nuclease with TOPRIM domain
MSSDDISVALPPDGSRQNAMCQVREALENCVQKLRSTSLAMVNIKAQGGVSAFFNKSSNIREIATHVDDLTDVQQQTLKLLVLLMGGIVRIKRDYNEVMETIELLSKENSGQIAVVDYLLKLRKTVAELKRQDEAMENLASASGETEKKVALLDAHFRESGQAVSQALCSLRACLDQTLDRTMQLTSDQQRLNECVDRLTSERKTIENSIAEQFKGIESCSVEASIRMAQLEDAQKIAARKIRFLYRQGKRSRQGLIWLAILMAGVTLMFAVGLVVLFSGMWK